ncbi:MAG: helix-turn-helix transcriptional regulator [Acidimicrobiales bacterium]|nr:helix-turn-helix transcriptional regulator [Acidimicrobiales bacterium]
MPEPSPLTPDQIAKLARGLASPARVAILNQFSGGCSRTTGEIVAASGLAQSTVSEHLRFLRDAELLSARPDGPRVWYCLRRSVIRLFMRALADWASEPESAPLVTLPGDEGPYR